MALGRDDAGRLARRLFPDPTEQAAFLASLRGEVSDRALLWTGEPPCELPAEMGERLAAAPWQPAFIDRVTRVAGFGLHPWHREGRCYAFDCSSTFTASVLLALAEPPRRILDLCAAPGGKTIFAARAFRPERLVANEVIGKRQPLLRENLNRCGIEAEIIRRDPGELAKEEEAAFDLVMVDAPCSGQSLPAKGIENPGCFHPVNVKKNAGRQRRILAAAARMVAPGGALFYSTCTFAPEENEKNASWLRDLEPGWQAVASPLHESHASHLVDFAAYRLCPHQGWGAGGFAVLLQKVKGE